MALAVALAVRMDLIYEGITTKDVMSFPMPVYGQNGPDLRRDYDTRRFFPLIVSSVRMDLIYEGITTSISCLSSSFERSEWT